MSAKDLLTTLQEHPRLYQLADRILLPAPQETQLTGLVGSAPAFLVGASLLSPSLSQINHLIICNDAEEAAYFHNTLESITEALDLFYFPSSYKNSKNFRLLNPSHVMLRTEALTRLSKKEASVGELRKKVLVTYPEALLEKVVGPAAYADRLIELSVGATLDVPALLLKLSEYNFERSDFVYEPGQFAMRGGILDIYSIGNDKPYRIELFGNEIESIRLIDPETQLSERKLTHVSVIPRMDQSMASGPG
ncbi:MAG: transcription-repair coupling factor, partial [Bacteroidota bacterium]